MFRRWTNIVTLALPIILATLIACNSNSKIKGTEYLLPEDQKRIKYLEDVRTHNPDSALLLIDKEIQLHQNDDYKPFYLKLLSLKSQILQNKKLYVEALEVVNSSLKITEPSKKQYKYSYVFANYTKGDIYFELKNYDLAYNYYFKARNFAYEFDKKCMIAQYDYRIAMLLYQQSKYQESLDNFKNAYTNYFDCGTNFAEKYRIQEILGNIGLCYFNIKKYDSADYYYNKTRIFINSIPINNQVEKKNIEIAKAVLSGNHGKNYLEQGKVNYGVKLLKYSIQVNSQFGYDNDDALSSLISLLDYYLTINDIKSYQESSSILYKFDSVVVNNNLKFLNELKANYYAKIGKFDSAFYYHKNFKDITDSLARAKRIALNTNIKLTMESLEKESEINKLLKEKQLRDFYYFTAISFAIVLVIIISIIIYFLRVTNKKNKQLENFNEEISKQKELLREANEDIFNNLEELNEREIQKNKILSIVAHDLRNPNNAIVFMAEELKSSPNISDDEREMLDLIESSAKSNNELIHEILHTGKVGKADSKSELAEIQLKDLMKQSLTLITHKAIEKDINLRILNDCPALQLEIFVDKIKRAICNILINAIKFSNRKSNIDIQYSYSDDFVNIHIRDYGIGIPDHIKPSLFTSDPSIKRVGTDGEASFGLGLGIVKQIIEEHKGALTFTSDSSGTEFIISLPYQKQSI